MPVRPNRIRTVVPYGPRLYYHLRTNAVTTCCHRRAAALPLSYFEQVTRDYTLRRAKIMGILENAHLRALPPKGAYYVLADFSEWDSQKDDFAFAKYMTTEVGVAVVPGSSFYHSPDLGKTQVRFAFAKKLETLDAAEERLIKARP